ncbi:MAG: ImmA/IrrE family metallo-endopeptidase [Deltaproteobacteria bacterium]|nr:ImmA/IrrE family metallo-endopeptidase [Deltaproteobacteria bacterium]
MASTWKGLGERVAAARRAAGITQEELASRLRLQRTSVTRLESGDRTVDALELAALAAALRRPIGWFVGPSENTVSSHRAAAEQREETRFDGSMDLLSSDARFLTRLKLLPHVKPFHARVESVDRAEDAATSARQALGLPVEPLRELPHVAERLGVFVGFEELGEGGPEGCYRTHDGVNVALVNGSWPVGRRRFTLAHEIGHHVLADAYAVDWPELGQSNGEQIINAFTIHFLMPRAGVSKRWTSLTGAGSDKRDAAIAISAEFGVSWSAACAQLRRFGLIDGADLEQFKRSTPREGDYLELEAAVPNDVPTCGLSPSFTTAVLKAFRRSKISEDRALGMLRGALAADQLPTPALAPLESMAPDLDAF